MSEKNHPENGEEIEHIQESTLIPPSHWTTTVDDPASNYSAAMDDPNDQVSVVPVSHAESSAANDKPMAAALHKDPSIIKKNAGYIAVAAFATVVLAAFAFKSFDNAPQTPPQIAQAPVTATPQTASNAVAVAPSAVTNSPAKTAVVAPIEINDASVPGSQAALETPTAVVAQPGVPTTVAASAPIVTTTVTPTEVAVVATPVIDVARIDSQISSNTTVVDLKTRVERLENNRQNASGQTSSASSETAASTEVKKTPVVSAAQRARQREAAAARQMARVSKDSKNIAAGGAEVGYSVHIVRDNLAWVRSPNGMISSYSLGDAIPGLGKLSKINEHAHTIVAGNRVIK